MKQVLKKRKKLVELQVNMYSEILTNNKEILRNDYPEQHERRNYE